MMDPSREWRRGQGIKKGGPGVESFHFFFFAFGKTFLFHTSAMVRFTFQFALVLAAACPRCQLTRSLIRKNKVIFI
jgi:hypothetical protein